MKNLTKKIAMLALSFCMIATAIVIPAKTVDAATNNNDIYYAGSTSIYQYSNYRNNNIMLGSYEFDKTNAGMGFWDYTVTSIKSSNTKVLTIKSVDYSYTDESGNFVNQKTYYMKPGKRGKSTITINFTMNGKAYYLTQEISVIKMPKAIKSLSVNGKKVNVNKFGGSYYKSKFSKTFRVNLKTTKNWKITQKYYFKDGGDSKVYKNNSKIKKIQGYGYIYYELQNKKTGEYLCVTFTDSKWD